MLIITIRTDSPEANICLYQDTHLLASEIWLAHRQLAETIHRKIDAILSDNEYALTDVDGFACFEGPGSFTGLRIGLTVANALAYSLKKPIVSAQGDDWIQLCLSKLTNGHDQSIVLPEYGAPVHITQPRK